MESSIQRCYTALKRGCCDTGMLSSRLELNAPDPDESRTDSVPQRRVLESLPLTGMASPPAFGSWCRTTAGRGRSSASRQGLRETPKYKGSEKEALARVVAVRRSLHVLVDVLPGLKRTP